MSGEGDEMIRDFIGAAEGPTKSIEDPIEDAASATTAQHGFYTGKGSLIGTVTVSQPTSASLTVQTDHRNVASTSAPIHKFRNPSTGHTYLEAQYSNDPPDGCARVEASPHPDLPHRGTAEKFHPTSASTIVASAHSGYTAEITSSQWPNLY